MASTKKRTYSNKQIENMRTHESSHRNQYNGSSVTGYDGEKVYTKFGSKAVQDDIKNSKAEPENETRKTLRNAFYNKKTK